DVLANCALFAKVVLVLWVSRLSLWMVSAVSRLSDRPPAPEILIFGPRTNLARLDKAAPRCRVACVCSAADMRGLAPAIRLPAALGGNGCGLRSSAPFPVPVRTPPVKHGRTLPSPIASRTCGVTCACASDWQLAGEKSNFLLEELI